MGTYVITKRADSDFQFNLKAANGLVILTSEGYTTKDNCKNGIASVRTNATDDNRYDRRTASDERFYFNLKAPNGQVIGTSQMYRDKGSMEDGIASVKTNAPEATVSDETE
jgi:uncharacterized protein YegP (UPF0339 family)